MKPSHPHFRFPDALLYEKNGIMDSKTGLRYRDYILAKGGTDEGYNLVKNFLGREPNQEAFFKALGL